MKHKTKTKALSWLLSLALMLSLIPGMSMTAKAAEDWSENKTVNTTGTISGGVTVNNDITLTINSGVTLTVNGGINASGHTLTVAGSGTLIVNGSKGNDGAIGSDGSGDNGDNGVTGNVTVTGGTVTINGGNGGNGGSGRSGGKGGDGGNGVTGNVKVTGGKATITGGTGGTGGVGGSGGGSSGSGGTAVVGVITGNARESDNNSNWSDVTSSRSTKRYVEVLPAHNHSFTYIESGDTITATCNANGCTLPSSSEGANDHVATLTIAPSSTGGNTAELTGDKSEFDLTGVTITYQKKTSGGWQNMDAAPGNDASGFFKASVTLKGTDNKEATASIIYGVSAVKHGTATNPTGKSYDFTVPKVAAVGAKITPTITPALDIGYGIKKITVKDENGTDVSDQEEVNADTEGFTMPEYNVTVDVEFGMIDYTIIKNDTTNGTFTVKNGENVVTTANYGDTVTLVATPDDGFALKSFTVKDSSDAMIELSGTGNTRTFTMPAHTVTVSATFEGAPFNLTISDEITGGTVTAAGSGVETADNATTAKAGSEVTLTVTPATGFELVSGSVTVTKARGGAVTVTDNKFTMPAEAVSVSATFVGKPVTASLSVTGNAGTTCTAAMLDENYKEISSVTKKAGEKFILLVNRDNEYDFNVKCGDSNVSMTEFTEQDYKKYIAYANKNNISISANTVLAWVTIPGAENGSVTLTVNFSKPKTFTILYQPAAETNPDIVICKIVRSVNGTDETSYTALQRGAAMGDGTAVWSMKMTAAFAPTQIAFYATNTTPSEGQTLASIFQDIAMNDVAVSQSTSDWKDITGGGKYLVIGGNAKVVTAAFITDASTMTTYKDNAVDEPETTSNTTTYQLAVCGTDASGNVTSFGTVEAPAAPTAAPVGKAFDGWRGFKFEDVNSKATEETYSAGATINVRDNATFTAVWKPAKLTVDLNPNGGTDVSAPAPVTYGEKLPTLENPTRSGFAFDGWAASNTVTEDGTLFAKGSPFDLDTPITANLGLTAQWKHVHSYSCYQISAFGDRLAKYQKYEDALHIAVCGCGDLDLMAHVFDSSGKCACGYQKLEPGQVTLDVSYGQWTKDNGEYSEKMAELPETYGEGQKVFEYAPDTWGSLKFYKWQYSTDDGKTWEDSSASPSVSFIIPCNMKLRALYINETINPQVELSARPYDDQTEVDGQTYTMGNILFHLNYKLPDGYTFEDAGIRLGDNNGISYYFIQQVIYSYDNESKGILAGIAAGFSALNVLAGETPYGTLYDIGTGTFTEGYSVNYLETEDNVLDKELDAATLAQYMYEGKPVNVEKYDPIYWEAKAKIKGMSGSMETIPPLRFAQKYGGRHYIYGIGYLRYKDKDGITRTIYTDALPAAVKYMPNYTVTKTGN